MRCGFTNKKCPKCGGNTYIDMDYYLEGGLTKWYEQECCLQCGHIIYDPEGSPELIKVTTPVDRAIPAEKEPLPV